ncbi:MAG: hypothetical protein H6835_20305, partial [Planctomycetes bacterium]|nr:hypothetical protein [Planctomycetota bacterium]
MRLLPALVAAPVAAAGLLLTQWRHDAAVDEAQARHFEQAHERSTRVAGTVETALHLVYQGLRTMSRLPGVRNIGRHGEGFDDDARQTVQELYNDLASNVSMSEVYIVP